LVRRLGALGVRQQALEADYRFALVHVRSHAESLAFLRGEAAVDQGLRGRFGKILANFERLIRWRSLVEQSSGLYAFLMQFVPYLVLSTAYFSGRVSLGDLTVGSIAFGQVQAALSFLIDRAEAVSGLFASLHRVSDLETALIAEPHNQGPGQVDVTPPGLTARSGSLSTISAKPSTTTDTSAQATRLTSGADLRLLDLHVAHPAGGRPLLEGLDLELPAGQRLLITGPSGSGKTSLLRVICGLTAAASGRLEQPPPERILVLPQQPFLPLGSLRDQLLFPDSADRGVVSDRELRELMRQVGLEALAERHPDLWVEQDWGRVLSGGEQQRLGFARLLLRRPSLAILDEASTWP
jgi:putative ATP-binding cassette transporter